MTSEFSYLNLLLTDFKFETRSSLQWFSTSRLGSTSGIYFPSFVRKALIIIFLINVNNWVKTICRTQIPISNGVWRKTEVEQLTWTRRNFGKMKCFGAFLLPKKTNNKVTKIIKDYSNQNWKHMHFSITAIFYLSYDSAKKLLHFFHKNLWVFLRLFFPKRNILSLLFSALTSLESRSFLSFL